MEIKEEAEGYGIFEEEKPKIIHRQKEPEKTGHPKLKEEAKVL